MAHRDTKQRLQITFGKTGPLKFTGNLDLAKMWERVLRRADLPIVYSQGFNTRPRIQLASALPLGITSECEILDVELREEIALEGLAERLLAVSPPGLTIAKIESVTIKESATQTLVRSGKYRIRFADSLPAGLLQERVDALLAQERIIKVQQRKRKKDVYDLRPLIYDLYVEDDDTLIAHVAVGDHGNLRPDVLLAEMDLDEHFHTVHRFELISE